MEIVFGMDNVVLIWEATWWIVTTMEQLDY